MDMNNVNIEEIVKQVLSGMTGLRDSSQQLLQQALRLLRQETQFRKKQE